MARELTYLDFDVLLERGDESAYRARVINAPAGQTPPVAFIMPFTSLELENFVLRIGRPRRVVRRVDAPETAAIKTFGGQLYRALFHDQVEVNLLRSLSEASAKGAGLRIRLRLSDAPELAELPWEFLYDQTRNRFLGLSDRTPLVRFLEVPDPPRPLAVSPPLQILVMIASPSDYLQLDVEQEWTKLGTALAPLEQAGQVQVTRLETASLAALRQGLRRADCHVLHFIGHGGFDPQTQDGVLVLADQMGRGRLVSGQDLGVLLHDHDPLRLVVLNACEGARADPSDPFAGTAQSLIQQGIPAVVAMQFEITDPAAIGFASELYAAVADGYPLDAALAEARKAIWADGNQVEWATPVLHLRAPDGRIFDIAPGPAAASPPSIAAVTPPASAVVSPTRATETEPSATARTAETITPVSVAPQSSGSAQRAMVERQAQTRWRGPLIDGRGDTELVSSGIGRFPVTWASRTENPEGKTSPEEFLAAAHATCYAMAFSHFLTQAGYPPERLHVTSTVTFAPKEGGGFAIFRSALEVTGVVLGLDQEAFQQAAVEAEKGCPISNTIRGNVEVTVSAILQT